MNDRSDQTTVQLVMRTPPARWSHGKRARFSGPDTYSLMRSGKRLMTVQAIKGGWFWYGFGENTAHKPVPDLETAKKQARDHWLVAQNHREA